MARLGVKYEGPKAGEVRKRIEALKDPASKAIVGAFRDAAKLIQDKARAEIASSGLGARMARGFTAKVVVPNGQELSPVMIGHHRLGYANIFERGGTIRGHPWLWIPLPTAPAAAGRRRMTPKLYFEQIGPLHFIRRSGKAPLLAGDALRAPAKGRAASTATLRTGARHVARRGTGAKGRSTVSVPIFVGVPVVQIRDRLNVTAIYAEVRAQLPELYRKRLAQALRR